MQNNEIFRQSYQVLQRITRFRFPALSRRSLKRSAARSSMFAGRSKLGALEDFYLPKKIMHFNAIMISVSRPETIEVTLNRIGSW
jgi:hypothetical protein